MRRWGGLATVLLAAVATVLAVPAGASPRDNYHESGMFQGVGAEVQWRSPGWPEVKPPVGEPAVVYLAGYRSPGVLQRQARTGSKPEVFHMPAVLAMGMSVPGEEVPAEVWCVPTKSETRFSIDHALTRAELQATCQAEVFIGEGDEPTGQTMSLSLTASWTGAGPEVSQKSVTKSIEPGWWAMDRVRSTVRPASARLRIVRTDGPELVLFDGEVTNPEDEDPMGSPAVSMFNTAAGHLYFGPPPTQQ
jgi:hypothetical protein